MTTSQVTGPREFNRASADGAGTSEESAQRICFWVLGVVIAFLAGLQLWVGPIPQNKFGHDTPLLLDGAWRILSGVQPHRDFYSPLGVLNYLVVAQGMKIVGYNAHSLAMANVLIMVSVALLGWVAAKGRLSPSCGLLFSVFAAGVAVCPSILRFSYTDTTYSTIYNRYAYGFLIILSVLLFCPRSTSRDTHSRWDAVFAGLLVALLFFLKVSYCMAALWLVACACLAGVIKRPWLAHFTAGAILAAVPFLLYLRFGVLDIYRDLKLAGAARQQMWSAQALIDFFASMALEAQVLAVSVVALFFSRRYTSGTKLLAPEHLGDLRILVVGAMAVVSANFFILLTNSPLGELTEVPLIAAFAFVVVNYATQNRTNLVPAAPKNTGEVRPEAAGKRRRALAGWWVTWLCGLALIAPLWLRYAQSFCYIALWRQTQLPFVPASERFDSPQLRDLLVQGYGGDPPMPTTYTQKINDGLSLLRRYENSTAKIDVFDLTNPFSFALQWPPSKGSVISRQKGIDFDEQHFPPAERMFEDTDILLVPKFPASPATTSSLLRIYKPYMDTHLLKEAQSSHWVLYKRRDAAYGKNISSAVPLLGTYD